MNPTEQVRLGRTRLSVTRLGLGSAPLGGLFSVVSDHQAHAVIERAYEVGLRYFDTAPLYGFGLAEQRMGQALGDRPRSEFILSTKVGRLLRSDSPPDPGQFHLGKPLFVGTPPVNPVFDYSYDGVMRSVEESLERLRLDRIDLLFIHDPDNHFDEALNGAYPALDRLRSEGTIGAVGAGMNQAEMLARFAREADFDCFLLAGRYTLLDQVGLHELLPLCVQKGIAIVAGGVYNSGLLANPAPEATFNYTPAEPQWVEKAMRIKAVCDRHGVPLKAAAIQFPLAHPAIACVLTGPRTTAELDENLSMLEYRVPDSLWEELKAESLIVPVAPVPLPEEGNV